MDAKYLTANVNGALSEALSAMVTAQPNDSIEFIGKYLLQYVERQKRIEEEKLKLIEIETLAAQEIELEKTKFLAQAEVNRIKEAQISKFSNFLESFVATATNKQHAMDLATNFTSDYFNIPACYIGIVKKVGDSECLYYYGCNKSQEDKVLGKKLLKSTEEGDEAPLGQGISFNAFKIPEVIEEEPPVVAEGEQPPPPKPAPTAQPLIIDDVMKNKNIKFFNIPKIGSYAAIPINYQTLDHDTAVTVGGAGEYLPNPINQNILFCMDTIGKYKEFKEVDITGGQKIAKILVNSWESLEKAMFTKHCKFLGEYKTINSNIQSLTTKTTDAETAGNF